MAKRTLIVSGALANKPLNGGNAWTRLSWSCGFRRLGYEVVFVERQSGGAGDAGVEYFRRVMADSDFDAASALFDERGERVVAGMALDRVFDAAASAEMLFNISGHCNIERLKRGPRLRVYFDDDPGYTQFWHADSDGGPRLEGHEFYYTVGLNIGAPDCPIPTGGVPWRHTKPPVVLEQWPVAPAEASQPPRPLRFTTVASWRGPYGPVTFGGRTYGLKAHEFRKVIDLPRRAGQVFEIALDIHPGDANDLAALREKGWVITDPHVAAGTPEEFRHYVRSSSAEFSVAQGVYVDTQSGWFSDRTTRYLASGRPALVQDTGFGRHVPCGQGLVTFRTPEEAAAGAALVAREYSAHCVAARALAERYFDSGTVLTRLLDEVGVRS